MSPEEVKPYVDMLGWLLGSGGLGAILLAYFGVRKAMAESSHPPPAPEKPSVGPAGLQHLGGLLADQHQLSTLTAALENVALGQTAGSELRRMEIERERHAHGDMMSLGRRFVEQLEEMNDNLRRLSKKDGGH